jgi:DNA repair protein RecO (recombination protein O)
MRLITEAIICSVRSHGEHGAIVRALTREEGLQGGYVRGGRSRRLRPVLLAGNLVHAEFRARTGEQLAQLAVDLVASRASLYSEPLAVAALEWVCALTATVLPEGHAYARLYEALDGLLRAIEAAPSAKGWGGALVRYELLLLGELGFGLDLSECAATGALDGLAYVSPRSGRAVSESGAEGYRDKMLPLPPFLVGGGAPDWPDIVAGLRVTGHFLERDLVTDRVAPILSSRERLVARMQRIAG